jgi:hypothetical protein
VYTNSTALTRFTAYTSYQQREPQHRPSQVPFWLPLSDCSSRFIGQPASLTSGQPASLAHQPGAATYCCSCVRPILGGQAAAEPPPELGQQHSQQKAHQAATTCRCRCWKGVKVLPGPTSVGSAILTKWLMK